MPTYDYRCDTCAAVETINVPSSSPTKAALDSGNVHCRATIRTALGKSFCQGYMRRVWSVPAITPPFSPYLDSSGLYVTSKRVLDDHLARKSEERTARTGVEHNFVAIDTHDVTAADMGVTDEGMGATHDAHVAQGLKPATGKTVF